MAASFPRRTHVCGLFAFQRERKSMCASILHFRKERNHESQQPEGIEKLTETGRRYEAMSHDVIDMHLFDEDADEEKALCGADTSKELMGVPGYLEDRVHGPLGRERLPGVQGAGDAARRGGHRGRMVEGTWRPRAGSTWRKTTTSLARTLAGRLGRTPSRTVRGTPTRPYVGVSAFVAGGASMYGVSFISGTVGNTEGRCQGLVS